MSAQSICTRSRTRETSAPSCARWRGSGASAACLSPDSVDPHNGKAVRASMGAIFHVPIERDVALPSLRARFERMACLDVRGELVSSPSFKTFDCYVFGNEARGLPQKQLGALVAQPFTIAGCGALESLNLATAVNICVYELNR